MAGQVEAVCLSPTHAMAKERRKELRLLAGLGVEGDAHAGLTVKHRSRVRKDPTAPNLRQVHLLHVELLEALRAQGFALEPGRIGENVTTRGVELLQLPRGTRLRLGDEAVVEVTGLRNPCVQLDRIQPGLMDAMLERPADGRLIRKAGVMAVVIRGGVIREGDAVTVELPAPPHRPLEPV